MHGSILSIERDKHDGSVFHLTAEMPWGEMYATTVHEDGLAAMLGDEAFAPIDDNDGGRCRLQVIHEGEAGFDPVDLISEGEAAAVLSVQTIHAEA